MSEVRVDIKITGTIEISESDASVLEYMTSIDLKSYVTLLGSKFREEDYRPVLERMRKASTLVLHKRRQINTALTKKDE